LVPVLIKKSGDLCGSVTGLSISPEHMEVVLGKSVVCQTPSFGTAVCRPRWFGRRRWHADCPSCGIVGRPPAGLWRISTYLLSGRQLHV